MNMNTSEDIKQFDKKLSCYSGNNCTKNFVVWNNLLKKWRK